MITRDESYFIKMQKRAGRWLDVTILCTAAAVIAAVYLSTRYLPPEEELIDKIVILVLSPVLAGVFGFMLFAWIFFLTPYRRFSKFFKEHYVVDVLQTNGCFTELAYHMKTGFDMKYVSGMNLFCMGDKFYYNSEDTLTGRYKGRAFHFGDVQTGETDSAGNLIYKKTLFYGQVAAFHELEGIRKSDGLLLVRKIPLDGPGGGTVERVYTENIAFNEKFEVYAEKPLNAFYILTPPFMEKIMEVSDKLEGQLSLCFYNDALFTAVNSDRDVFDPKVDIPLTEQKDRILNDDVELIMGIVDVLLTPNKAQGENCN